MDDVEIRLQCVEIATAGDVRTMLQRAAAIYKWVTAGDKPKRGRPPKQPD